MNRVEKKTDAYSIRSSISLKGKVNLAIKKVFVNALRCIEIRFGTDFEGFESMRKEILRCGNDSIRYINEIIDNEYNVESIPSLLTFVFKNNGKVEGDCNARTEE